MLPKQVPVWSAYSSIVGETMPVTRVGTLPLIAAPAHQWNTILTVVMQAQAIDVKVVHSLKGKFSGENYNNNNNKAFIYKGG